MKAAQNLRFSTVSAGSRGILTRGNILQVLTLSYGKPDV
jgi:hypothetical protein